MNLLFAIFFFFSQVSVFSLPVERRGKTTEVFRNFAAFFLAVKWLKYGNMTLDFQVVIFQSSSNHLNFGTALVKL